MTWKGGHAQSKQLHYINETWKHTDVPPSRAALRRKLTTKFRGSVGTCTATRPYLYFRNHVALYLRLPSATLLSRQMELLSLSKVILRKYRNTESCEYSRVDANTQKTEFGWVCSNDQMKQDGTLHTLWYRLTNEDGCKDQIEPNFRILLMKQPERYRE